MIEIHEEEYFEKSFSKFLINLLCEQNSFISVATQLNAIH